MVTPGQIRTPRLLMRPLDAADRAEFVRWHEVNREHIAPWWPARAPGADDDAVFDDQLRRTVDGAERGTDARFAAFLDDGRLAAFVNLGQIFRGAFESCYIGWSVSVECTGRGVATEAVRGVLGHAFAPRPGGLGLHRVQANIMPANAPSLRVAEKCGFRREGLARAYLKIAGRWEDHAMFAVLAEDFRAAPL